MKLPRSAGGQSGILAALTLLFLGMVLVGSSAVALEQIGSTTYGAHPPPVSTAPTPATTDAATIQRIESLPGPQGHQFIIHGDRPLRYQVFNLSDPPRLLLRIANARLSPAVQPVTIRSGTIDDLTAIQSDTGAVHIEVRLASPQSHDVIDDGNRLHLTIPSPTAALPHPPEIHDLEVAVEPMRTTVGLRGTGPGPLPRVHRLHDPPRLVMDLTGFTGPDADRTEKVDSPEVATATLVAGAGKARLVVTLKSPEVRHELITRQGLPTLVLTRPDPATATAPASLPGRIEDVLFERDGAMAVVRIATTTRETGLKAARAASELRLTLTHLLLPPHLVRRMDVTAFASPIRTIDTYFSHDAVQFVIRLSDSGARHEIVETPREILVRVHPVREVATGDKKNEPVHTGKKISMDFKDINIHNALKLIAEVSKLNIIVADSVSGTLSMRLVDVPWDQALDLILAAKGLDKEVQGNVIRIAPMAEIQATAEARRKTIASQEQLEPFITELIPVSFANAQDLASLLKEGVNNEQQGTRILSPGGAISIDARTSTLIIKDIARNIAIIRDLVAKLDKPTAQVLIEARVVEINRSLKNDLGIRWSASYVPDVGDNTQISTATMVDVGIPGASGTLNLNLGTLSPLMDLDIELSALEATGKAKTISSPRVLTMDNQQASITQGENVPYNSESESGGTTVQFVEASLKLSVTPHVTPNGFIALKVSVTNNSIGSGGSPPPINTKEVSTQALVRNNETIVLGGIFTKNQTNDSTAVPGLNKIPFLGDILFKNKSDATSQSELLIFITPRIVPSGAS
ncbi:MAG: type IV pilus secretin PilQ [Magnetococcales bacterium]|nr:type IV pilus secretin PilQ [Magnetococcales bacterium]